MPDHVVIQVRDEIVARLIAGVSGVAGRVYLPHQIAIEELDADFSPFLAVILGDDSDERVAINGGDGDEPGILEDINKTVFVHCVVKMDGDAEKAALNLRAQVETALLGTSQALVLGGKAINMTRVAAANNRDEALDLGAYNEVLQLEVKIRHLESRPDSFTT